MARKPSVKTGAPTTVLGLMELAYRELDQAITRPSILQYEPYPAQLAFHECTLTGRYLSAGNRAGKTTAAVIEAIRLATNTDPYKIRPVRWGQGPLRMRFVVVDVDKGVHGILLPELKRWCTNSMLINGSFEDSWNNTTLVFTFANGSTIQFLTHGMDLDKHGGVALHAVFFDEIPPQSIFNENMMRLVDYDGIWVLAATSVDGMGWTYELLWEPAREYDARVKDMELGDAKRMPNPGEIDYVGTFELSQKDNPHLQTVVQERSKFYVGMDASERKIREEGAFVPRAGRIFPTWNVHEHVTEERWIPPRDWAWYTSVDFGYNNPTAWLWHAVSPDGRIYTFAELYKRETTPQQFSEMIHAREAFWHVKPDSIVRVGDPNNGTARVVTGVSYVSEYANNGIFIGTENIPRQVEPGILKMQQYIRLEKENGWGRNKPRWMISPACENLIREMKKLRWASFESQKKAFDSNKQEEVHKKDDHAFDSSRYLFTFMPELQPSIAEIIENKRRETGVEMDYAQTMAMLRADDRVSFDADRQANTWDIEYLDDFEEA